MQIAKITKVILVPAATVSGFTVEIAWRYGTSGAFNVEEPYASCAQNGNLLDPVNILFDETINPSIQVRVTYTDCDVPYVFYKTFNAPAATTTTTTTAPPAGNSQSLTIAKDVSADSVTVVVTDLSDNSTRNFESANGENTNFVISNVFDPVKSYTIDVTLVPSGRADAPIYIGGNIDGQLATTTPTGTTLSATPVNGQHILVQIGT